METLDNKLRVIEVEYYQVALLDIASQSVNKIFLEHFRLFINQIFFYLINFSNTLSDVANVSNLSILAPYKEKLTVIDETD